MLFLMWNAPQAGVVPPPIPTPGVDGSAGGGYDVSYSVPKRNKDDSEETAILYALLELL